MLSSVLPPQAVAQALDVGRATLDHWIEEGWLPVHLQPHRGLSIDLCQVLRFVRQHHLTIHHPDALGLSGPDAAGDAQETLALLEAFATPEAKGLEALLVARFAMLDDLPGYLDGPVTEALRLGRAALSPPAAPAQAAQALGHAAASIRRVAELIGQPSDHGRRVMVATLDDDRDPTHAALAALVAVERGWSLVGPGPAAGNPALARAAQQHGPEVVILAPAAPTRPDAVTRDDLLDLTEKLHLQNARVIRMGPAAGLAPRDLPRVRSLRELSHALAPSPAAQASV